MPSSEDELLEQAVTGDGEALAQLLELNRPQLRRVLAGEIPQRWQAVLSAEDLVQETSVDAFLDVSRFEPRGAGSFTAWLLTLAKRNLLDALRMLEAEKRGKNRRQIEPRSRDDSLVVLYEWLGCATSTPSRHAARKEAHAALQRAVEQLPPTYRTVVEMYDLEGRPVKEVAAALRRSPGAVFMLRCRAHRHLREFLGTGSRYLSDSA